MRALQYGVAVNPKTVPSKGHVNRISKTQKPRPRGMDLDSCVSALGGIRTPNLLIRRCLGAVPRVHRWSPTCPYEREGRARRSPVSPSVHPVPPQVCDHRVTTEHNERTRTMSMDDELTTRREQRRQATEAWFMAEWDQLDDEARRAIADFVTELHESGLRERPAAVAWLAQHLDED